VRIFGGKDLLLIRKSNSDYIFKVNKDIDREEKIRMLRLVAEIIIEGDNK
jgi:hypothetical protein